MGTFSEAIRLRILQFRTYKKLPDVRRRISHGYISLLSAD